MDTSLNSIVALYSPEAPLAEAWTIPALWYTDQRMAELERLAVFSRTWQAVGRTDQLAEPGCYFTTSVAGEPIVVVRDEQGGLRAFLNVCRHHAAALASEPEGKVANFRCPYHGWTYGCDGSLKGTPEFDGVRNFDRSRNGLVPVRVDAWENFVFVNLDDGAGPLSEFLGALVERAQPLNFNELQFFERRTYALACNWKVFTDNYLDGGYHVPHLHKGLNSVLDYSHYTIENVDRCSIQSSPVKHSEQADPSTAATRKGDRAYYFWFYPNFMINWYDGAMDTNLVLPIDADHCQVIFDFYFRQTGPDSEAYNRESVQVSDRIQQEDTDICMSVQRGLKSRGYTAGRLSARREAGEHLFHRLLFADLKRGAEN
jgi:phenylpropionate dioxygenase-like ring-hydroxylating dioxygenase large terminal subunit